ncbi:MAG: VWA domain-containing protein [Pseudomonadota bacterium]
MSETGGSSRRRSRREVEQVSLSFLDVISCGFGAVILLLVISKFFEPVNLERRGEELDGVIQALEAQLEEIRGEATVLNRELVGKELQLSEYRELVARLQGDFSKVQGEFESTRRQSEVTAIIEERLAVARQELTEEMQRLIGLNYRRSLEDTIGGIPVDSEYIIFIVDTSGSMQNAAWDRVLRTLEETLDVYPTVKGMQVMNDMGEYMFPRYAGDWIPDTPGRRKAVLERMRTWAPFSNSSPVEGIQKAISTFYSRDKRISLYVLGDEFASGGSMENVLDTVDRLNRLDAQGTRRVRIHAVGYPTQFLENSSRRVTGVRFATLMRAMCERNGGTFVGLTN